MSVGVSARQQLQSGLAAASEVTGSGLDQQSISSSKVPELGRVSVGLIVLELERAGGHRARTVIGEQGQTSVEFEFAINGVDCQSILCGRLDENVSQIGRSAVVC